MNFDQYGEVINGGGTYRALVEELDAKNCVVIGWTDQEGTHLDILFTLSPRKAGTLQGGVAGQGDLFVSIMRMGAFAFEIGQTSSPAYYAEKLFLSGRTTASKLADMCNTIRMSFAYVPPVG